MIEFTFIGIGTSRLWFLYNPLKNDRLVDCPNEYWIKVNDVVYKKWEPQFLLTAWEKQVGMKND